MTAMQFIIYGLAVWRVSSLLVHEQGPFNVFTKIRELAGIQHDTDGKVWIIPSNFFAQVLSCVWCVSLWVSFVFIFEGISTVLALSAMAILIERAVRK